MNRYPIGEADVFAHRPKPFYFITTTDPEALSEAAMHEALSALKEEGFGGIVLFNKPPRGFTSENYLTDAWFDMVRAAAKACRDLSLEMWINNGFDFPPGSVAGKVRAIDPTLYGQHLILKDGQVIAEKVEWGFPAFEHPRSAELFRELVYEAYLREVGDYFGDPIVGFFSDTDNRRVDAGAMYGFENYKRNYFPWSDDFANSFEKKYGYDITPYLKDLLQYPDLPQAQDYWEHAGHLYQSWFETGERWAHEHGLLITGHAGDTSPFLHNDAPRSSAFTEGRFSDVGSHFDYPGTDQELYALDGGKHMRGECFYLPNVVWGLPQTTLKMTDFTDVSHDMRAKQAAATAYMLGKRETMCEMFAATNFGVEPGTLARIAAFQIMQGITFLVTHAYHHRFFGEAKYFAPPDFSPKSMLSHAVRELNDHLAEMSAMMASGKPLYPIALIDPTEDLWRNRFDGVPYFDVFTRLNREVWGFTVCDRVRLANEDLGFRIAIEAGIVLSEEERAAIEANGITVIGADALDRIPDLLSDCTVRWDGEGTPHFARRIIDGEEFVFIANIEQNEPIRGTLSAYGRKESLLLYPGDIRYVSAQYDNIPARFVLGDAVASLPQTCPVTFHAPNAVSLEYFVCDGTAVTKDEDVPSLEFPFTVTDAMADVSVMIPTFCLETITAVTLDGIRLSAQSVQIFDDAYSAFALPVLQPGKHTLMIEKTAPLTADSLLFLSGEFDVSVEGEHVLHKTARHTYNLCMWIPDRAEVTLSARHTVLKTDESWSEQGQPFYSGGVTYHMTVAIPQDGRYLLSLGEVRDTVTAAVDGTEVGKCIRQPYDFVLELCAGMHCLDITVYNSYANLLEGYAEIGGLLSGGTLCPVVSGIR